MSVEKKTPWGKIIYGLTAVLLFGILVVFPGFDRWGKTERSVFPVVIMGDSVVGQCRDKSSVAGQLEALLEKPVYNGAFGGTSMSAIKYTADNYTTDLMNMVGLSKAIAADDFGVQQTARSRRDITDYYGYVVDELACIDFEQVEILVLAFGLNDYHGGVPLDNAQNPYDEATYGGALRSIVRTIRQKYPDIRLVLVTPTYTWYLSNGLTCEEYDTGEAYLESYVETLLSVATEVGVETVDWYHGVYPHDNWQDWAVYTEDGLHPNEEGRAYLAGILAEVLK